MVEGAAERIDSEDGVEAGQVVDYRAASDSGSRYSLLMMAMRRWYARADAYRRLAALLLRLLLLLFLF